MTAHSPEACSAEFTAALIRRDLGSALALLSEDVVFFFSNGASIIGKEAFAALMTQNWARVCDYDYSALDMIWIRRSDADASVIYSFAWSGTAQGAKVGASGRGTRVLTKDGVGWRIRHEHLSPGQFKPE